MSGSPFTAQRLLLCEGTEDAGFLRSLIHHHSLGPIDVRPVGDLGGIGGISGFGSALIACVGISGFRRINSLGLVIDCDQHHHGSFADVCRQITAANKNPDVGGRFEVPTVAHVPTGGKPRITIITLPEPDSNGGLETLLWKSIAKIPSYSRAIHATDQACSDVGITPSTWGHSKRDKARMRVLTALLNRDNPAIALSRVWTEKPDLVPISSAAFTDLAQMISALP